MRQTLSQVSKTVPKGQPFKIRNQCLGFWSLPLSFTFILLVVCYFSAVTNIILYGIYPSNASLLHTCTLWMHVPYRTVVELLLEGCLLAPEPWLCTCTGPGQEAWWWSYWRNLSLQGKGIHVAVGGSPRTELEGKCRQERWIGLVLTAWAVCILLPSPRDEQLSWLVLHCGRTFLGHLGHLGKKLFWKRIAALSNTLQSKSWE